MRILSLWLFISFAPWRGCFEELGHASEVAHIGVDGNYHMDIEEILRDLTYDIESMTSEQRKALRKAELGDREAIRAIALGLTYDKSAFGKMNLPLAAKLYQISSKLGDIPSMVNIGAMYAEGHGVERSPREALDWFLAASKSGHQGATYNVGLLLAEGDEIGNENTKVSQDVVSAFEYFHLAYSMFNWKSPAIVNEVTTNAAKQAHDALSDIFAFESWGLNDLSRIFVKGNLNATLEKAVLQKWNRGLENLQLFNAGFESGRGVVNVIRRQELRIVLNEWTDLLQSHKRDLSKLQVHILLDNLQDVIGPLAGNEDAFVTAAGELGEAFANSDYCMEKYARSEDDMACFNGAVSAAMSYYRRASDKAGATRVFQLARKHPHASTHWQYQSQTPRVFHQGLRASPWWNEKAFEVVKALESTYQSHKESILKELDTIVNANEGVRVRRGGNIRADNLARGSEEQVGGDGQDGLERVYTPHIGVRVDDVATENTGAGGWSEFGPLFDGLDWSVSRCKALPTLCETLKKYQHRGEICGLSRQESEVYEHEPAAEKEMRRRIESRCGADTIITVLRLRPGTNILPHCGTTNGRLIMHFALRGAKGVRFRAGDTDEQNARGGWVQDYKGGDGHAVIFDDSFEHEVRHNGDHDRFVLLVVLRHPDIDAP